MPRPRYLSGWSPSTPFDRRALRDRRDQVLDAKGLANDFPDPKTFGHLERVRSPTHDDHRGVFCIRGPSPDAHELGTAHQGQAQIDQQNFRPRRRRESERVSPVQSGYDVVAGLAEFMFDQSPRVVIVLNDEHAHLRHGSLARRPTTAALVFEPYALITAKNVAATKVAAPLRPRHSNVVSGPTAVRRVVLVGSDNDR